MFKADDRGWQVLDRMTDRIHDSTIRVHRLWSVDEVAGDFSLHKITGRVDSKWQIFMYLTDVPCQTWDDF